MTAKTKFLYRSLPFCWLECLLIAGVGICRWIPFMFQLSIDQGHLPSEWKLHLITPIYKSGNRSLIKNYRPISLFCIISKVLERLVFDHIIEFLSTEVINSTQFRFLRGKSTILQLLLFLEDITFETNLDNQVESSFLPVVSGDFKEHTRPYTVHFISQ